MGRPKALVELRGRPLVSWAIDAVATAGLDPIVVAKPGSPLPPLACRVEREESPIRHPIAGIVAALAAARGGPVVVIGCDMPFVPPGLLAWLASLDARVVVPRIDDRLHPLLARYDDTVAAALVGALEREAPLQDAISSLGPSLIGERELARFGDPRRMLLNVNTPADLAAAERAVAEEVHPAGATRGP